MKKPQFKRGRSRVLDPGWQAYNYKLILEDILDLCIKRGLNEGEKVNRIALACGIILAKITLRGDDDENNKRD